MSKMIQLRNVPDALHRTLKACAAVAERPTLAEFRERLHQRKPVAAELDTARLVREERENR
jgi:plasmid stability protein